MIWRLLIIIVSLTACASTVWNNDKEAPINKRKYSDRLINYNSLSEEAISTLRQYISGKIEELIDHANNTSNEKYALELRSFSKAKIRSIMNFAQKNEAEKADKIIQQLQSTTLDQFVIQTPRRDPDSVLISDILLRGEEFIQARIRRNLKLFGSDTLSVWEVKLQYTGKKKLQ